MKSCFSCGTQIAPDAKFCLSCGQKQPDLDSVQSDLEVLQKELAPAIEVLEKIGQGGMADIYLGRQVSLDRKVVIKLLFSNLALDPRIQEKFLMESKVAANLKHTHIVDMIDQGVINGRPYFIMEYGLNGSLQDKLVKLRENRSKLPFRTACEYILNILDALDFAHSKNVNAHRDVKPDNILFRENGVLFLSDFGIALRKGEKIHQGEKLGSPPYMSPEQFQGKADLDFRTDLYSVGILFFELITSEHPFASKSTDWEAAHLKDSLPPLIQYFSPQELSEIKKSAIDLQKVQLFIEKACAKDPKDRFQSAKEMIHSLKLRLRDQEKNRLAKSLLVKNRGKVRNLVILSGLFLAVSGYFLYNLYDKLNCEKCCIEGNCESGSGTFRFTKKNIYTGEFRDRKHHGRGKIVYENGNWYEGGFRNGELHGDGILYMIQKNGDGIQETLRYMGNFQNGKIEGKGTVHYENGSVYSDLFHNGEPTGENCTIETIAGDFYNGQCKDMDPHGKGFMRYADQSTYEGEFRKGLRHGKGRQVKDGKLIFEGIWKENQPYK